MYSFKHLRGKHDQKDHGRRAIGGGASARALAQTRFTPEEQAKLLSQNMPMIRSMIDVATTQKLMSSPRTEVVDDMRRLAAAERQAMRQLEQQRRKIVRAVDSGKLSPPDAKGPLEEIDSKLLFALSFHEGYREKHNELLSDARKKQGRTRSERTPTPTQRTPKQNTTTPFEPLDEAGLLGWKRHRPEDPPDYTQYDAAIPAVTFSGDQRREEPRRIRDLTRTPEGEPVRILMDRAIQGAQSLMDVSKNETVNEDSWNVDVFRQGDLLFPEQQAENAAFWTALVPTPRNEFGYGRSSVLLSDLVSAYGFFEYRSMNGFMRNSEKKRRDVGNDLDNLTREHNRNPTEASLAGLDQFIRSHDSDRRNIAGLDAGMRPAPRTVMVRRGVGENVFSRMQQHLKVGDRFTDDGFTSASINPLFSWETSPMVNVILTEGTPVLWTNGHAQKASENEVIIGRGVTFEVVSTDNERGWILRTVPPDGPYTPPPIPDYVSAEARRIVEGG